MADINKESVWDVLCDMRSDDVEVVKSHLQDYLDRIELAWKRDLINASENQNVHKQLADASCLLSASLCKMESICNYANKCRQDIENMLDAPDIGKKNETSNQMLGECLSEAVDFACHEIHCEYADGECGNHGCRFYKWRKTLEDV